MADNKNNNNEPEANLGEANIEGKNAAYFANLPSNINKASQQNENAAASANYKTPKNFGKSAVLNAEQRKALRNKLAKLTPSKYKVGEKSAKAVPKFKAFENNTIRRRTEKKLSLSTNIKILTKTLKNAQNKKNEKAITKAEKELRQATEELEKTNALLEKISKFKPSGNITNSRGLLTGAEKFNFTRKKPKTNAINNNTKVNSPEVEAERELQNKITPIAEKVQLLEKLKETKYKLQDGITGKVSDMTLKEYTVTINDINKKLKEFGYIDGKVKNVKDYKQYVPFIFDTELEALKSELLVKQKELKEAHKKSIALNRKLNSRKKFLVNAQKAQKLRVKSLAAYHAPNKNNMLKEITKEVKKTGVKVNPFDFEYTPHLQKIETEPNENDLDEEASAKRLAAAKEKVKALIEKNKANLKAANEKARAEGKPVVSEPAYVPKPVELNEEDTLELASEVVPEPPSEPAPKAAPEVALEPVAAEATPLADLPPGWEEHRNNEGQVYYSNGITTQWERPNGSSVLNTKSTEEFEAQLAELKTAKAAVESQLAELKAAKEAAEAEVTELKSAKEAAEAEVADLKTTKKAAEAEVTELKAAKEAAEAQVTELNSAKEAAEAQVTELKSAKEAVEAQLTELKAAKEANKPKETNSEPTSPTQNSNSKNTTSNNPQPSDEEKILEILEHGEDGFPPLELPEILKTNFEHAIKPFYDKTKALPPNQAYVELYVKLYVLFYEVNKEKISDGDLFEEGTKTDLAEFLTDDVKQKIKDQVTNAPYYDLMFRLGISKLYHESLTDALHILDNLDKIDLTSEE